MEQLETIENDGKFFLRAPSQIDLIEISSIFALSGPMPDKIKTPKGPKPWKYAEPIQALRDRRRSAIFVLLKNVPAWTLRHKSDPSVNFGFIIYDGESLILHYARIAPYFRGVGMCGSMFKLLGIDRKTRVRAYRKQTNAGQFTPYRGELETEHWRNTDDRVLEIMDKIQAASGAK